MINTNPKPAFRVNTEAWREIRRARGLDCDEDLADYLQVDKTTVYRVISRGTKPGATFLAATMFAFGAAEFLTLFHVAA